MIWEERRRNSTKQSSDTRTSYDIDYGRIIHCASFRRLQGKTQILNLGDSDFYRTRLTHTLEVAQIATGIRKYIKSSDVNIAILPHLPDTSLIQAVSYCHDLGHPPFGHGGEIALNYCMRNNGGFEGNGQTLRILTRLETYSKNHGANLTRRCLLGVLKYPVPFSKVNNRSQFPKLSENTTTIKIIDRDKSKPPKCYLDSEQDVVDWILSPLSNNDRDRFQTFDQNQFKHHKPIHKSLDCSLMDLADDIAYGVHDLEDVIALSLISKEDFKEVVDPAEMEKFLLTAYNSVENKIYNKFNIFVDELFSDAATRKFCISRLVYYFVQNAKVTELNQFDDPLLKFRITLDDTERGLLDKLQNVIMTKVIARTNVQHFEFKGQDLVVSVFEALASDPLKLLPTVHKDRYINSEDDIRIICDAVSEMTDNTLMKTYERLFSPRMGSIFDRV